MGERVTIVGPDGRRNRIQPLHATCDNLSMVYNTGAGPVFLESDAPDGSTELTFADDRGRFQGLCSGTEYRLRTSASEATARSTRGHRAVSFAPGVVTGATAGSGSQRGDSTIDNPQSSALPTAAAGRKHQEPVRTDVAAAAAAAWDAGDPSKNHSASAGFGAVHWGHLDVGDFAAAAGAPSGAGTQTRPRSRGGACAREGILPVSRGLRDTSVAAGGRRFEDVGADTAFTATHTQTHTHTLTKTGRNQQL